MLSNFNNSNLYLAKYQVSNLVFILGTEKIEMFHNNIISIEYLNNYEVNLRAILKVKLRIDIRKKLWILKNKRDIVCKFELSMIGMDPDVETFVTVPEIVWNQEFKIYFNDEEENIDVSVLEQRLSINEGNNFNANDIDDESYFESQNTLDVFLFNQNNLNSSKNICNEVFTKNTLQQCVGRLLTASKHTNVLMSKFENGEIYEELLVPANPAYKALAYLDQNYGFYKKGALIYYDIDVVYILNTTGKVTAKREDEWTNTSILVSKLDTNIPGNGMIYKEGEKIFYVMIGDGNINPKKESMINNVSSGSSVKLVMTDDTLINEVDADLSYIDQRNTEIFYSNKYNNKYSANIIKARMEENECTLYISAKNLNINAFTPNKIYQVIFSDTSKHERYGKFKYRLAYAYHFMGIESDNYMSSSHMIMLKKCSSDD